jgi:predicted nuclease of predicted toxin-antitoxin system
MRLYVDEDSIDPLLLRLLRGARHDVLVPADLSLMGSPDPVHLRFAIREGRILHSRNYDDYLYLHELIVEARGHHPGIFMVRRDNDPTRDLKPARIVRAIANLVSANIPVDHEFHILNHWR